MEINKKEVERLAKKERATAKREMAAIGYKPRKRQPSYLETIMAQQTLNEAARAIGEQMGLEKTGPVSIFDL